MAAILLDPDSPFGHGMWAVQRPFHPESLNILHASIPKKQPNLVIQVSFPPGQGVTKPGWKMTKIWS